MKNQPEVKFLLDQIEKIVDVRGREFGQQLKLNVALRGFDQYAWVLGVSPLRGASSAAATGCVSSSVAARSAINPATARALLIVISVSPHSE